jgi:hypothetical protein
MKVSALSLIMVIVFLFGCVRTHQINTVESKSADSAVKKTTEDKWLDSITAASGDRPDEEQEPPSLAEEKKSLINSYNNVKVIDTLLEVKDSLRFYSRFYCLKNSRITIPKKYVFEEKNPVDFVTYHFANYIKISKKGKTVFEKTIVKKDFDGVLNDQLKRYGVLHGPYLKFANDTFNVGYSVSIPITDIGVGVSVTVSKNGNYVITGN